MLIFDVMSVHLAQKARVAKGGNVQFPVLQKNLGMFTSSFGADSTEAYSGEATDLVDNLLGS